MQRSLGVPCLSNLRHALLHRSSNGADLLDRDGGLLLHPVIGELAGPEEGLGPFGVDAAL